MQDKFSSPLAYACVMHILKQEDYEKEPLKGHKHWTELTQYCHSILCYEVQTANITLYNQCQFIQDLESTYKFIHPAIAPTFKYTYSDNFSISYVGDKTSFFSHQFKNQNPTNTQKQIILIAAASALLYLETKGTSLYCLNLDNLIFNKDGNPKFLCAGIPSIFKPKSFSPAQSFAKFAKSLFSEDKIPSSIKTILDQCNNKADFPSLQEIYDFFIDENRFLPHVDSDEIEKYLKWLKFQDKFPCEYFYELNENQINELIDAFDDLDQYDLAQRLSDGKSFPRWDPFAAMYYSENRNYAQNCFAYFASPQWFMNLNDMYKQKFYQILRPEKYFEFAWTAKISNEDRAKLISTKQDDVTYVIDSYIKGTNSFMKSPEAAHRHIRNLLKNPDNQIDAFLNFKLGEIYENGIGVIVHYEKALVNYQMAKCHDKHNEFGIDEKIDRVKSKKAEFSRQMNNLNEECRNYLEKANNDEFKALMYVAFSFLHGLNGFPLSQLKAKEYYIKAADIDPYVLCILGNLYRLGTGFPKNLKKAAKLYARADTLGCSRGRAYHGFMMMRDYSPFKFDPDDLKDMDRFYFDYKNHQGDSNPLNYCRMIQIAQCHFPLINNTTYLSGKDYHYISKYGDIHDSRRHDHQHYIKETLNFASIRTDESSDPLSLTDTHISLWFIFYQLTYFSENGLCFDNTDFSFDFFRYKNHRFMAISEFSISSREKEDKYSLILRRIRGDIHPDTELAVKVLLQPSRSFKDVLSELEKEPIHDAVDMEDFQEFVRECKNIVPYDSAKILVTDIVEQANSGDSQSIQECAFNYFYGTESFPINYQESFKYYEILAGDSYNNSTAQLQLGIMYSMGIGVNQNYSEALKWLKKSSDQKNVQGRLNYALFLAYYNKKIKAETDPYIPYFHLLEDCCHTNDKESLFQMGKLRESYSGWEHGRESSIKYYRMAYQLGHIESARRLYHVYKKLGMKKEQNSILSFLITINDPKYLYIRAQQYYDHGDYDKSFSLTTAMMPTRNDKFFKLYGDHLLHGHGVKKNVEKAKKYYLSVAENYPLAVESLANIYADGIDCEPDIDKAQQIYLAGIKDISWSLESQIHELYGKFCEKHDLYETAFLFFQKIAHDKKTKESQYKVAMSLLNPKHNECKKNIKKGLEFLKLSADQSYPDAEYELGYSYIYGKYGQKRDFEKGIQYLSAASRNDHLEATYLVGKIYFEGIGTIPDTEKSQTFFLKAAKRDHNKAKYYAFLNCDLDYYEKLDYLEESAKSGYAKAQFKYGDELIQNSFSEGPDYEKGIRYIKKAARKKYRPAKKYLEKLQSKNNE